MNNKYRYIYLSEANEYEGINLDILKETANAVLDAELKNLLAMDMDVLDASGLPQGFKLDNLNITDVEPEADPKLDNVTGFTVSIPMGAGQTRQVNYDVKTDLKGRKVLSINYGANSPMTTSLIPQITAMLNASDPNVASRLSTAQITNIIPATAKSINEVSAFTVIYSQESGMVEEEQYRADRSSGQLMFLPMGTLGNNIKTMLLQTIPNTDPKKKAMLDTGEVIDIEPKTAVQLPAVTSFKLSYTYNGDMYEPEYTVTKTSDNKIVFRPVDNKSLEDRVMDALLDYLNSMKAPEGNAVAATGKISDIQPENAQSLDKVQSFRLTYKDESGASHVESYNFIIDPSGKMVLQKNESLENNLLQHVKQQFANDPGMTNWLSNAQVKNIQPVENTEGKNINEVKSFEVTDGSRTELFVQTQQNGKLYFAVNSVEDDLYRYINSLEGMESITPQNSSITITDPAGDPAVKFENVNAFTLSMNDGTSKFEFKASNQPGKPKAFTVQKLASSDLRSELQTSLAGTPIAKAYSNGYIVKDVRPGNASNLGDVQYFMVSDAYGNSMQYFGLKNGKPEVLELPDMIRLYATSPESGLQYYKTPAAVTAVSNISQDKKVGNTLDSVKGFTLTLENKEAIPMVAGKDSSGVLRFKPIDAKEGDSTAPGQGLTITDKDKKRIEQLVNKTLNKMGHLQFAGWTNFRER